MIEDVSKGCFCFERASVHWEIMLSVYVMIQSEYDVILLEISVFIA